MVVAHGSGEEDADPEALCGNGEAVDEGVVSLAVGPHQELALRAAPRDHVRPTGKNLAWNRHTESSAGSASGCQKKLTWEGGSVR